MALADQETAILTFLATSARAAIHAGATTFLPGLEGAPDGLVVRVEPAPATFEDVRHNIRIAALLRDAGVPVPHVHGRPGQVAIQDNFVTWYSLWEHIASNGTPTTWVTPGIAELLARIHHVRAAVDTPAATSRYHRRLLNLIDRIDRSGLASPAELRSLEALVDDAFDAYADLHHQDRVRRIVHGDFTTGNVIAGPESLYVIDFEYSGVGAPTLDLVKALNRRRRFNAPAVEVDLFLDAYQGAHGPADPGLADDYLVIDDAVSTVFAVSNRRLSDWHAEQASIRLETMFSSADHVWAPTGGRAVAPATD